MATGDAYSVRNYAGSAPEAHLNGSIGAGDAAFAFQASEGTGWPTANFPAIIDYDNGSVEKIYVGARAGVNLTGVVRGVDDTLGKTHLNGAKIRHVAFKQDFVEANAIASALTTKGDSLWKGGTATVAPARLAAGTDQQVIRFKAANALGVETTHLGSVPVFSTTGARDAAIAAPTDGQADYQNTGDAAEGPFYYHGTAWRLPWNMPWGLVTPVAAITANQAGITAVADITSLTVTWTAVANRNYRLKGFVRFKQNGAAGDQVVTITDPANVVIAQSAIGVSGTLSQATHIPEEVKPFSAGSQTLKMRAASSSTADIQASATARAFLYVEDAGPSGAPT